MDTILIEHLKKQIKYLNNSCNLYDDGDLDEAIRIAATLRVIMYDNNPRSPSLLQQLGIKQSYKILTQSSSFTLPGEVYNLNMGFYKNSVYKPNLGEGSSKKIILVDDWLNQKVVVLDEDTHITKLELIKAAAHKDGGAHVGTDEPDNYAKLKKFGIDEAQHFVALRQMAYEFLVSVKENVNLKSYL